MRQFCGFFFFNAVGYSVLFLSIIDSITCVLLIWGVWISVEEKIAMCVFDVEMFQTFLDTNLVIVKKLFSVLLF